MRKVVFMLDGYCGPEIRKYCVSHLRPDDYLYRIFCYDTEPLDKKGHHPITKKNIDFGTTRVAIAQRELLKSLRTTPNFCAKAGENDLEK